MYPIRTEAVTKSTLTEGNSLPFVSEALGVHVGRPITTTARGFSFDNTAVPAGNHSILSTDHEDGGHESTYPVQLEDQCPNTDTVQETQNQTIY